MAQAAGYFHLHLVSDATGETLITVARAAAAQYVKAMPVEHVHPLIRTQKQLDRVLTEIEESPGIVLYTLLEDSLVERLEKKCRELGLPYLSVLGPVLHLFQPISAPNRPIRLAPNTRSMPNISAASTRSTTP
jgi:regulator of PEP synthase PpsR (kinase-PPPase family)